MPPLYTSLGVGRRSSIFILLTVIATLETYHASAKLKSILCSKWPTKPFVAISVTNIRNLTDPGNENSGILTQNLINNINININIFNINIYFFSFFRYRGHVADVINHVNLF